MRISFRSGAAAVALAALLGAALLGVGEGFPEVSGSCNGLASGNHLPNEASGDGGFTIKVEYATVGALNKGNVTVASSTEGYFVGFLLKSFNLKTGEQMGTFKNVPAGTILFDGCPNPDAALSHWDEGYWDAAAPLTVEYEWPADADAGFVAYLVASEQEWFVATGDSKGNSVLTAGEPLHCPASHYSPGAIIVVFLPIIIILLFGGAVRTACFNLDGVVNHSYPLGGASVPSSYWSNSALRAVTVDVIPALLGLSLGEMLAHLLFWGSQALCYALTYTRMVDVRKGVSAIDSDDEGLTYPVGHDVIYARALGHMLQYNLALVLLFPTRTSLWNVVIGISYERSIKYHRIVGRWIFFLLLFHWVVMAATYQFDTLTVRKGCYGEGNLFGTLAGILFVLSIVAAVAAVRRKNYEAFRYIHMLAWPALIFACLHATSTIYFLILPLILYFADHAIRAMHQGRACNVLSAQILDGEVTHLRIQCPAFAKAMYDQGAEGIGAYCFLMVKDVSGSNPVTMHPFSISGTFNSSGSPEPAAQPYPSQGSNVYAQGIEMRTFAGQAPVASPDGSSGGSADGVSVHIKNMGPGTWSDLVMHAAKEKGSALRVSMEGPFGSPAVRLPHYPTIVCVAGGIGFTPMAPLLEMALDPACRGNLPHLRRLEVVWVVRDASSLAWFGTLLQRARFASAPGGAVQIKLHLYVTKGAVAGGGGGFSTGRPDIAAILSGIRQEAGTERVAVLACGPEPLMEATAHAARANRCHIHRETFLL